MEDFFTKKSTYMAKEHHLRIWMKYLHFLLGTFDWSKA
jgi:hypothetical protein